MSAEEQLRRLAEGPGWVNPLVQQRARDSLKYAVEVQKALRSIPGGWESKASSTAQSHLRALSESLMNAAKWLKGLENTVTEVNVTVQGKAAQALAELPAGDVPGRIIDAVKRGDASVMTPIGAIAVSGIAAPLMFNYLNSIYANRREEQAANALEELRKMAQSAGNSYRSRIAVGFDVVKPKSVTDDSQSSVPGDLAGTGVGIGVGTGVGVGTIAAGRIPSPISSIGNPPSGTPTSPHPGVKPPRPDIGVNPPRPENPHLPAHPLPKEETLVRPPIGEGSGNPRPTVPGPGENGNYPPGYTGPSVDSSLGDGQSTLGMRSGLGAAGLGAVGLAAGAKLASGASGAGGLGAGLGGIGGAGGAGMGGAGAGSSAMAGTSGTGATGAGASNSGSGAAKGAGTGGAGRSGMMMGGQGGGGSDKSSGPNRLGYVAPKFEDDYEENLPHPASRAGKRGE